MKKYTLGLYEKAMDSKLNWEEKLACAKRNGFDFVELSIDETDEKLKRLNWSKNERLELLRSQFKVGLPITSMCLSGQRKYPMGSTDEKTRKTSMEIIEKAIVLASDLGIRIIQVAGYDVYYEKNSKQTESLFYDNLKKSVDIASKYGVVLGFETMETPFMDTVSKAMRCVKLINSPYLKVYPDIGNLTNASEIYDKSLEEDMAEGMGNIVACHIKETVTGKYRDVPFGKGHVDFIDSIKTAYKLGVRRFTAEFWYKGSSKWEEDVSFANSFIKSKLNQISL